VNLRRLPKPVIEEGKGQFSTGQTCVIFTHFRGEDTTFLVDCGAKNCVYMVFQVDFGVFCDIARSSIIFQLMARDVLIGSCVGSVQFQMSGERFAVFGKTAALFWRGRRVECNRKHPGTIIKAAAGAPAAAIRVSIRRVWVDEPAVAAGSLKWPRFVSLGGGRMPVKITILS
jgi:hypothetical protein